MSDTAVEDFGTGTDGTASPSVKIPITVKHHITPPEEPDDLTAGDSPPEDGAEDAFFVRNDAETTTQSETSAIDPYRSFKFTVEFDGTADGDHDIIFDPDGDLKPPVEPVGASDGPHQGRHDIGGYVPSTIIDGATDLQAPETGGDTGSVEGTLAQDGGGSQGVGDLPDIIVLRIPDDEEEGSDGSGLVSVPDDTAAPIVPDIIIRAEKHSPPPPSDAEIDSGSSGHFTQMAWDETRDSAGDSFDFTDLPDDAEAPVLPEIILRPKKECPPSTIVEDPDDVTMLPDAPAGEDTFDWSMELA